MKTIFKMLGLAYMAVALGLGCALGASYIDWNDDIPGRIIDCTLENRPMSGMFFSTEYVVEEYEYEDAYCLLYDDADANLFECEIIVDLETFQMVHTYIEEGKQLVGALVLNDDYSYDSLEVYTFMPDPEFEMAEASANF